MSYQKSQGGLSGSQHFFRHLIDPSIQGLGMLPPFPRHHPMAKIKPSSPS